MIVPPATSCCNCIMSLHCHQSHNVGPWVPTIVLHRDRRYFAPDTASMVLPATCARAPLPGKARRMRTAKDARVVFIKTSSELTMPSRHRSNAMLRNESPELVAYFAWKSARAAVVPLSSPMVSVTNTGWPWPAGRS